LIFRLVGWACAGAIVAGVAILTLDVTGIRLVQIRPLFGFALIVGAFAISGACAAVEVFFFSDRARRDRWLEHYRQSILPFRAIEDLIEHRRKARTSRAGKKGRH
jgi:hypothetical protein